MRRSTEKKLIVLTEKELIEKALDDIEEVTSLNSSTIIEDFIMKSIFPKNNAAKSWVTYMYKYNWKTNQVLEAVFEYLSAGINWKARYTNAFPLINFSHQLSYYRGSVRKMRIYNVKSIFPADTKGLRTF